MTDDSPPPAPCRANLDNRSPVDDGHLCTCATCSRPLPRSSLPRPLSDPKRPKTLQEWMITNDNVLNCKCNKPAYRRQSRKPESYGQYFYTCYKNYQPGCCDFFKWDLLPTPPKTPEMSPERRNRTISASQATAGGSKGGIVSKTPLRSRIPSINRNTPTFQGVMRGLQEPDSSSSDENGGEPEDEPGTEFIFGGTARASSASPTKKASTSRAAPYPGMDRPISMSQPISRSQGTTSYPNVRASSLKRAATLPEPTLTNELDQGLKGEAYYASLSHHELVTLCVLNEACELKLDAQTNLARALQLEVNALRRRLEIYPSEGFRGGPEQIPPETPGLLIDPDSPGTNVFEGLRGMDSPTRQRRFDGPTGRDTGNGNGSSNGTTVTVTPAMPGRAISRAGAMTPVATPAAAATAGSAAYMGSGKRMGRWDEANKDESQVTSHFPPLSSNGRPDKGRMWN